MAAKQYRVEIDLGDPNRSHTKLISWTGHGKRVLDVGCATGAVGHALNRDFGCAVVGISAPYVGIHGTPDAASIGYSASHGCVRMLIPQVEWLFTRVDLGTPVFIVSA